MGFGANVGLSAVKPEIPLIDEAEYRVEESGNV